jgi:hypothetical protein
MTGGGHIGDLRSGDSAHIVRRTLRIVVRKRITMKAETFIGAVGIVEKPGLSIKIADEMHFDN